MSIWAIIPVKPLTRAKSRLAEVLSPDERQRLSEMMFRRVLTAVKAAPQVAGALVISRDTRALAIARDQMASTVFSSRTPTKEPEITRFGK